MVFGLGYGPVHESLPFAAAVLAAARTTAPVPRGPPRARDPADIADRIRHLGELHQGGTGDGQDQEFSVKKVERPAASRAPPGPAVIRRIRAGWTTRGCRRVPAARQARRRRNREHRAARCSRLSRRGVGRSSGCWLLRRPVPRYRRRSTGPLRCQGAPGVRVEADLPVEHGEGALESAIRATTAPLAGRLGGARSGRRRCGRPPAPISAYRTMSATGIPVSRSLPTRASQSRSRVCSGAVGAPYGPCAASARCARTSAGAVRSARARAATSLIVVRAVRPPGPAAARRRCRSWHPCSHPWSHVIPSTLDPA
ncbi:hypothetical protein SHIRM173S_08827 [Streptomyces hirsutus]